MKVLMLGWEFPPFISGGLGTACKGLTDALIRLETQVLFILPKATSEHGHGVEAVDKNDSAGFQRIANTPGQHSKPNSYGAFTYVKTQRINPYKTASSQTFQPYKSSVNNNPSKSEDKYLHKGNDKGLRIIGTSTESGYEGDLIGKIQDYAGRCKKLVNKEDFDVIHAHDWITFPAAVTLTKRFNKPLIAHIHATEFDRSGEYINQAIYNIERQGMHAAEKVIAVSGRTKKMIIDHYNLPPEKVEIIHNGIDSTARTFSASSHQKQRKNVLFLGRVTGQKGPHFFVEAAARVSQKLDNVNFIIAGNGDLMPHVIDMIKSLGLHDKFECPGFLNGDAVWRMYQKADVYVMPSISEPFGLTALEAVQQGVPVVISKNSGVAEILKRGALKVDFWDVELIAKMIIRVLKSNRLADRLRKKSNDEINGFTWEKAASGCINMYYECTREPSSTCDHMIGFA